MTPQERQLIDELFGRLAKLENAPRDPEAQAAIAQGLRNAPNAVYALVQTALVQDEALRRANARIQELEQARASTQSQSGGFLDSMREAIFGQGSQQQGSQQQGTQQGSQQNAPQGSVPNVPPPASRPVWNSGQALQQAQSPGQYDHGPYGQGPYGQGSYGQGSYGQGGYGQAYGAPQSPFGGGGSFLGTAAAAAAGMVGGSLLLNGIRSMMGGPHVGFGNTGETVVDRAASPWSDQSGSTLAHDAGVDDIGRADNRVDDTSRAGLFDQASNDPSDDNDPSNYGGDDRDDMDMDADDNFGGGGDDNGSDYA